MRLDRSRNPLCSYIATLLLAGAVACDVVDEAGEDGADLADDPSSPSSATIASLVPTDGLLVTLYTWRDPDRDDYFTTSAPAWAGRPGDRRSPAYAFVRSEGRIYRPDIAQPPGTVALRSYWNAAAQDNRLIAGDGPPPAGYSFVRLEGYALTAAVAGTIRLRSYFGADEAVTADPLWSTPGYSLRRVEGYVFPPSPSDPGLTPDPVLFGYDTMRRVGSMPLLLVYARFTPVVSPEGDAGNTLAFYERMVFSGNRNIPGYFSANSYENFTFSRAGAVEVRSTAYGSDATTLNLVAASGYDFARHDRDGDGTVSSSELAVIVINKDGVRGAQTRPVAPLRPPGSPVTLALVVSFVGEYSTFSTMAHEVSHQLGTYDLYGPGAAWNDSATLMGATETGTRNNMRSFHLDPWHKLALGWIEPRVISLREPVNFETLFTPGAFGSLSYQEKRPVLLFDPLRGTDEFFLLEARSPDASYDADVASRGLAIWHVRLDATRRPAEVEWEAGDGDPDPEHRYADNVYNAPLGELRAGTPRFWVPADGLIQLRWDDGVMAPLSLETGGLDATGRTLDVQIGNHAVFRARIDRTGPVFTRPGETQMLSGVFGLAGPRRVVLRSGAGADRVLAAPAWVGQGTMPVVLPAALAPGEYSLFVDGPAPAIPRSNLIPVVVE